MYILCLWLSHRKLANLHAAIHLPKAPMWMDGFWSPITVSHQAHQHATSILLAESLIWRITPILENQPEFPEIEYIYIYIYIYTSLYIYVSIHLYIYMSIVLENPEISTRKPLSSPN